MGLSEIRDLELGGLEVIRPFVSPAMYRSLPEGTQNTRVVRPDRMDESSGDSALKYGHTVDSLPRQSDEISWTKAFFAVIRSY